MLLWRVNTEGNLEEAAICGLRGQRAKFCARSFDADRRMTESVLFFNSCWLPNGGCFWWSFECDT